MTPEQIATINAIATILDKVGSWPVGTLFFAAVAGPWLLQFFLSRAQERRFDAVKRMYENNVELVKTTQQIAQELQQIVIYNIQVMTEVRDMANNNLFCPIVRKETKQREVDR